MGRSDLTNSTKLNAKDRIMYFVDTYAFLMIKSWETFTCSSKIFMSVKEFQNWIQPSKGLADTIFSGKFWKFSEYTFTTDLYDEIVQFY